jgi:hypothetical protein
MARFAISAVAIAASLVLSDCAAPRRSPEGERPPAQIPATIAPEQSAAPTPVPPAPAPASAAPAPAPAPVPAPASAPTPTPPTQAPSATKASPGATSGRPVSKPGDTVGTAAPKPTPAAEPVPKATVPESPKAQTLDLGSLEQRLKDTKAIGVFTKLSLKNQVDDLLGELRAFHNGSAKTPTAVLRQKYDTLMIKVLTLLQDGDPQLASVIASSREALWGILMDPKKFAQI